ncbi:D-alanyl-D-alanine carboxypeptidase [Noviherbaspirillum cavernae]|uniref:D-alanyl-D-alanine carboxypeptidase n=1 Tax=Noviherbaspirillum cavernae TaxID=2320862 RepID=A0A418X696_9BURK|nr:D-alanyl-D-alanine carboxypeptidase [Noviherbaspirillum cavernae]
MLGSFVSLLLLACLMPDAAARERKAGASQNAQKEVTKKAHARQKGNAASPGAKAASARGKNRHAADGRTRVVKKFITVHGRRKLVFQRVAFRPLPPPVPTVGDLAGLGATPDPLMLQSNVAYVVDASSSDVLFEKNAAVALPIASITKLMTGLIVMESGQNMDEVLEITDDDIDKVRNSSSKLQPGASLTRADMLHIALMSSENRAASALGRNHPGGTAAFVAAMNAKAGALGMSETRYVDATGLSDGNVASARDLAKLVIAALAHPMLALYSIDSRYAVDTGERILQYVNSNRLVSNLDWQIGLQKTGFINESGRCLVMHVNIRDRPIVMVFLDSKRRHARFADADRLRQWVHEKIAPDAHFSELPLVE